jgi:2',3'-cyclic-nucleotide 2'-phosphodiesterase (5'-nucleotidase family)
LRDAIRAGPVTVRDIFNASPYENRVVNFKLKGKDIRSVIEHGVGAARIAQFSGISATFRRKRPWGRRLESVTIAGKPLRDDAVYSLSTVDYLAKGGGGYAAFEFAVSKEFTKTLFRDVLYDCARKQGIIRAPTAGRLTSLGD